MGDAERRNGSAEGTLGLLASVPDALRLVADQLPVKLIVADASGVGLYVNVPMADYVGRSLEALTGQGWQATLHPDDLPDAQHAWRTAIGAGEGYRIELRLRRAGDGSYRWHRLEAVPLREAHGDIAHWLILFTDIDEQVRATQREEALAALGLFALEGPDLPTLMDRAARLVAESLEVEFCKVLRHLPGEDALLLEAGVGWREGLVGTARVPAGSRSQAGYALEAEGPVKERDLRRGNRYFSSQLLLEHGAVSGMSVLIQTPEGPYGVLGAHTRKPREFHEEEAAFLQAVANILGEAVRRERADQALRASLLDAAAARDEAEVASQRLSFLAEASQLLAASLDFEKTLSQVTRLAVPRLADWCAVDLLDEQGRMRRVAVAHQDPDKVRWAHELHRRYPPDPDSKLGVYQVARSGQPRLYPEVTDAQLVQAARDETHLQLLRQIGFSSGILAPLVSRGRTLGVLTLVHSESGRHYGKQDLPLATQLAERAALAVDNAQLYREAQSLNAELEARVRQRTHELETANAELEAFTYSASHDLRAPLRGIDGFSEVLVQEYSDVLGEAGRHYLGRVRAAATRMGQLIDDLLFLSRVSRSELRSDEVDLSGLAVSLLGELRAREPEREVAVAIQPGLRTLGDARLLRIAFDNLLGNAWKFTAGREHARIEMGWDTEKQAFFVRDNGAGFDMAYADKLFVPFQRLHSDARFEGTGIGLATAQRVVRKHGGRIWAESTPDGGASFYVALPSLSGRSGS